MVTKRPAEGGSRLAGRASPAGQIRWLPQGAGSPRCRVTVSETTPRPLLVRRALGDRSECPESVPANRGEPAPAAGVASKTDHEPVAAEQPRCLGACANNARLRLHASPLPLRKDGERNRRLRVARFGDETKSARVRTGGALLPTVRQKRPTAPATTSLPGRSPRGTTPTVNAARSGADGSGRNGRRPVTKPGSQRRNSSGIRTRTSRPVTCLTAE